MKGVERRDWLAKIHQRGEKGWGISWRGGYTTGMMAALL